jgi:hypothetical protein
MDHSPFEGLFKTLVPILIFVVWALISRPAQKKKKEEKLRRRRQREMEEAQRQTDLPSGSEQQPEPAKEEWKQSIEDVLEEMGFPVERKPAPPPSQQPVRKPVEEKPKPSEVLPESQSLEDMEPEVVPQKAIPEKAVDEKMKSHLAIQEAAYTLGASPIDSKKVYATATEPAPALASETRREPAGEKYAAEELQKFIVWSELLGKPVALRDERATPF